MNDLIIARLHPRSSVLNEALDFIDGLELADHGSVAVLVSRVPVQMAPELVRIGLAYNVDPLSGERRGDRQWIIRNVVRLCYTEPLWQVPDCFPDAVTDMAIITRSPRRFFDIEPVRKPVDPQSLKRAARGGRMMTSRVEQSARGGGDQRPTPEGLDPSEIPFDMNPNGAPPSDWWVVDEKTEGGWLEVRDRLVSSMVPARVCTTCGAPSRRIVDQQVTLDGEPATAFTANYGTQRGQVGVDHNRYTTERETVGWTICGHGTWREGNYTEVSWP